jgi:hypothetical protein
MLRDLVSTIELLAPGESPARACCWRTVFGDQPLKDVNMFCCNPTLAKCGGEAQHLEKLGIWSPPRLPNVQGSTARPKTPLIGVFLVSLERSWNVDIENDLALAIWTSEAQVMGKRRAGSQESTSSRHPIWACNMALERSRQGLQLWFRPCRDRTLQSGVMAVQSSRSLVGTISGLHFGSPKNLCHLDVAFMASCRKYYMGEGEARVRAVVSFVCPSARGLSQHPRVSRMLN